VTDKAAFLVQTVAFNLLIDPAWSKRAFSLSFAGPKRVNDPDSIAAAIFVCSEVAPAAQCFEQLYFEQPHVQRSQPMRRAYLWGGGSIKGCSSLMIWCR
jgi:hypothetical protein